MKTSLLVVLAAGVLGFGCAKKVTTMTEKQAKEAGYVVAVTNNGVSALFPDHMVINGTNIQISSTNITVTPINKAGPAIALSRADSIKLWPRFESSSE